MFKFSYLVASCAIVLSACTATDKTPTPKVEIALTSPTIEIAQAPIELATPNSEPVFKRKLEEEQPDQRKHPLMDKTVCRSDTFNFYVKDQNGFKNQYSAKVQAQGKITQVHAKPWVTIEIINWYSDDPLLAKWRAHLDHAPFNHTMKLEAGQTYRQQVDQWQFCKLAY